MDDCRAPEQTDAEFEDLVRSRFRVLGVPEDVLEPIDEVLPRKWVTVLTILKDRACKSVQDTIERVAKRKVSPKLQRIAARNKRVFEMLDTSRQWKEWRAQPQLPYNYVQTMYSELRDNRYVFTFNGENHRVLFSSVETLQKMLNRVRAANRSTD